MKNSHKIGLGFGITSGIITTLGLIIGLHSLTKTIIITGIMSLAISDSLADALGIYISQKTSEKTTSKEAWESAISAFLSKFILISAFIVPVYFLPLYLALAISIAGGILTLIIFNTKKMNKKIILTSLIIISLVIILIKTVIIIPVGSIGVYNLFEKIDDKPLTSGVHIINPLAKIIKINTQTQNYNMQIFSEKYEEYLENDSTVLTKEGLNMKLDLTVLFHLLPEKIPQIYENIGIDYKEIIIYPEIKSITREVMVEYNAKDIYSEKRTEATSEILVRLKNKVEPRGIIIEDVLLRNIQLPENLAASIEANLQAEQEVEQAKKQAERKRIEAEGEKEAQQIINQGLTKNYLHYLYLENLKDFQGTIYVPTDPDNGLPLFKNLP